MTARILITDDHPVVLRGLRSLLERRKEWKVCGEARTGKEAVQQVKLLKPDIVIIDISMPGMNGIEAIRRIRELNPHIGILALTMYDSEPMFRGAMEAGAHAYVLKSDVDNRLIDAVEALQEDKAFFSPGISHTILKGFSHDDSSGYNDESEGAGLLTPRQRQVLKLLVQGKTNKEVATVLDISPRTAETHRYQMMSRLKIQTLSELVLFAVRNKIVEP